MPMLEASTADLAYLAALIDGEGCLTPHRPTNSARVRIKMNEPQALRWCHRVFGGNFNERPYEHGTLYTWELLRQRDIVRVLDAISPYLRLKQVQAEAATELARASVEKVPPAERRELTENVFSARKPVYVIALDPGDSVGWARVAIDPDGGWHSFRHGITPLKDMAMALYCEQYKYDFVVVEDWRLYPAMAKSMVGSSFPSVQFIGMVRFTSWHLPHQQLVTQGAGIKKTADKTLKANRPDLYEIVTKAVRHDDGHDQDAIRHLWHWFWRNYIAKGA